MNRTLIDQIAIESGLPTLSDPKSFDQDIIWNLLHNCDQNKNLYDEIFNRLTDATHLDNHRVFSNDYYCKVIWRVRDHIVLYFNEKDLKYDVANHCSFPHLLDENEFDQEKIWSIIYNAKMNNYSVVNKENIFDLLVDSIKSIDKHKVYNNEHYRSVIWKVRNQIVNYFNM